MFARAYQAQLAATGKGKGDLTGQAAIQALLGAMKKGKVTSEILTYAGQDASNQARQGGALDRASTASQAEQQRYQNSISDLAVVASNAGVEEGFARIFRTLNAGLDESNGLVENLANGFNEATKWADDLLLWPQSFARALEGRDSLVADWLGKDQTAQIISDYNQIKAIWTELSAFKSTDIFGQEFLPTLQATTQEIKNLLDMFARLKGTKDQAKGIIQEEYQKDPSVWGNIKGVAKSNWYTFTNTLDAINPADMPTAKKTWGGWLGIDSWKNPDVQPNTQFDDTASEKQFRMDSIRAAEEDTLRAKVLGFADYRTPTLSDPYAVTTGTPLETIFGMFAPYRPQQDFKKDSSYLPVTDLLGNKSEWQPSNLQEQADWNLQTAKAGIDPKKGSEEFNFYPKIELDPYSVRYDEEKDPSKQDGYSFNDMTDNNRQAAMSQAEQTTNNTVNNQFDIVLNVDATLAGVELETQAREMANSFSSALTTAFEQVQVNYPQKQ